MTTPGQEPDFCNSLNDCAGGDHCPECSHAYYFGEVTSNGRWAFEFNPQFGVSFRTTKGEARAIQPAEKNPVWDEWQKWHDEKFGVGGG